MSNLQRYVCIHGHFYQPSRENPWTGAVTRERSALPYHDWNQRISHECYSRLAATPLVNADGRIDALRNLYQIISFNAGPTLLAWLEKNEPEVFTAIIDAGKNNSQPPLAQSYNHALLPLCDTRDIYTQISWGLKDFRHRFGRTAQGMWLPETAINPAVVSALISSGVRFTILSPSQAVEFRHFGDSHWHRVSEKHPLDTGVAYRIYDYSPNGQRCADRWLDVLFYNPRLSLEVSFNHALRDLPKLLEKLQDSFNHHSDAHNTARLALIATDGEIYGHHEPEGNVALAKLLEDGFDQTGIKFILPGEFLSKFPPNREVRLHYGEDGLGSSWSCSHGVGRWTRDCGCRMNETSKQNWRQPLRQALDALRDRMREHFVNATAKLLFDPWEARDEYIDLVLTPDDNKLRSAFLERHARPGVIDQPELRQLVWKHLENQRHALLMYTSCGWFFDEFYSIEPLQNLRHAYRALELTEQCANIDLLPFFLDKIALIPGLFPDIGNSVDLFRNEVIPARFTACEVGASRVLSTLLNYKPMQLPAFQVRIEHQTYPDPAAFNIDTHNKSIRRYRQGHIYSHGLVTIIHRRTRESNCYSFFTSVLDEVSAGAILADAALAEQLGQLAQLPHNELLEKMSREAVFISQLPQDDSQAAYLALYSAWIDDTNRRLGDIANDVKPLLRRLTNVNADIPPSIGGCVRNFAWSEISAEVTAWCQDLCPTARLDTILADAASDYDLLQEKLDLSSLTQEVQFDILRRFRNFLLREPTPNEIIDLDERLAFARDWGWDTSNLVLGMFVSLRERTLTRPSSPALRESLHQLGDTLSFSDTFLRLRPRGRSEEY